MSDIATPNEAPRGAPYGARAATEASLDAVPMAGSPQGASGAPAASRRDPRAVTEGYQPPENMMGMPDEAVAAATSGLPMPQRPTQPLPPANREALSLIPLMPTLERIARMPGTSPAFRRFYASVRAQLPPEVTVRDL